MALKSCCATVLLGGLVLFDGFHIIEGTCTEETLAKFPSGWPKILDSGVYWYGADDTSEKATGQPSQFYDPAKPTLIFVHGWTGYGPEGGAETCRRWTAACSICPDQRILSAPWVERGWNYGIFYWDQFADEPCTRDTELKIWANPSAPEGLVWKSFDMQTGQVASRHYDKSVPSLGHLCAILVRQALPGFRGPTLRLVGHSFGAQLAAHCAMVLHQEPGHSALPSRIVLLDPFFTGNFQHWGRVFRRVAGPFESWISRCSEIDVSKKEEKERKEGYGGLAMEDWLMDVSKNRKKGYGGLAPIGTVHALKELWKHGVVSELYKGTWLTMTSLGGDPVNELQSLSTYVITSLSGGYCHHHAVDCGHSSLVPQYMERLADPQPFVENGDSAGNCTMPGPACSDQQIRTFIQRQNQLTATHDLLVWRQVDGSMTLDTADDSYQLRVVRAPTDARLDPVRVLAPQAVTMAPQPGHIVAQPLQRTAADDGGTSRTEGSDENVLQRIQTHPMLLLLLLAVACLLSCAVLMALAVLRALRKNTRDTQSYSEDEDLLSCEGE